MAKEVNMAKFQGLESDQTQISFLRFSPLNP